MSSSRAEQLVSLRAAVAAVEPDPRAAYLLLVDLVAEAGWRSGARAEEISGRVLTAAYREELGNRSDS